MLVQTEEVLSLKVEINRYEIIVSSKYLNLYTHRQKIKTQNHTQLAEVNFPKFVLLTDRKVTGVPSRNMRTVYVSFPSRFSATHR